MKSIDALLLSKDDLKEPKEGFSFGNLKPYVFDKAVISCIVLFDGRVVKNRFCKI